MADEGMRTIKWEMSIGLVGCRRSGEFEIENDATEEDIYSVIWEHATQYVETVWTNPDE